MCNIYFEQKFWLKPFYTVAALFNIISMTKCIVLFLSNTVISNKPACLYPVIEEFLHK